MFALDKLKKKSVTIWKFFPLLHSCKDFDIFDSFSIFNHYNLIIILIHNEGRPIAWAILDESNSSKVVDQQKNNISFGSEKYSLII